MLLSRTVKSLGPNTTGSTKLCAKPSLGVDRRPTNGHSTFAPAVASMEGIQWTHSTASRVIEFPEVVRLLWVAQG
ncbi:hypothetical protein Pelo_17724 [Pelomyxa schiedti]|nr:hypothetical protein Pelo_17724 [Pelomyxa schiedti]